MEIIARFPALSMVEPRADQTPRPQPAVAAPAPAGAPVRRSTPARGRTGAALFPVRSVAVLAVIAVTAWSLALKNEAARRHAAHLARAEAAKRFERVAQDLPVMEASERRAE